MTTHYLMQTLYHHLIQHPRQSLTNHKAHTLLHSLGPKPSRENVNVSLCHGVTIGMLKVEQDVCPCCFKSVLHYTLTDKGRIHANRR